MDEDFEKLGGLARNLLEKTAVHPLRGHENPVGLQPHTLHNPALGKFGNRQHRPSPGDGTVDGPFFITIDQPVPETGLGPHLGQGPGVHGVVQGDNKRDGVDGRGRVVRVMEEVHPLMPRRARQEHLFVISGVGKMNLHPMEPGIPDQLFQAVRGVKDRIAVFAVDLRQGKNQVGGISADAPPVGQPGVDADMQGFVFEALFKVSHKRAFLGALGALCGSFLFFWFFGPVHEHDGYAIFNGVSPFAGGAFDGVVLFAQGGPTGGTNQNVEQVGCNHFFFFPCGQEAKNTLLDTF